jgi:hypothetical protein
VEIRYPDLERFQVTYEGITRSVFHGGIRPGWRWIRWSRSFAIASTSSSYGPLAIRCSAVNEGKKK